MSSSDELSAIESATLIVLMAENRDIPNTELVKKFYLKLAPASRSKLTSLGYVHVDTSVKPMIFRLTDAGWARCKEPFDFKDSGAKFTGAALGTLVRAVQEDLRRCNRSPAMMFDPGIQPVAAPEPHTVTTDDLLAEIRLEYKALAQSPGDWVNVADLRERFGSVRREDMDAALRELEQQRDVNIVPQADENSLSERTRQAAVIIGRQPKHFIAIGV